MKNIKISGEDTVLQVYEEHSLLDGLLQNGYFVDNPCNGKGTCGKCQVKIVAGDAGEISASERKHLTEQQINSGIRLACYITDWTELEVEMIQEERKAKVLTAGYMPDFERDFKEGYGISIDIGTTTVAISLVDLKNGQIIEEESMVNMQKNYGLDVLTRITYSNDHPDGLHKLQEAIVGSINTMIGQVCKRAGIETSAIKDIVVGANTTMAHLFLGVDPGSLGRFPYTPEFTDLQEVDAKSIGLDAPEATVYTLPHVSAFVGGDVVAGVYVAEMDKSKENQLFIDIGTNGEIVLAKEGKLYSCSCAAGPALEGMNISCGMRAQAGAIEDVKISEEGVELKIIDDEAPLGICGSGILAVVKELLKNGMVTSRGAFIKKDDIDEDDYRYNLIGVEGRKRHFVMDEEHSLFITQNDVRQVQLAKGAILSGFVALLREAGIDMDELSVVYVAGQFGAHLPEESLVGTGILPPGVEGKVEYLGNSSKTGAYMALMSDKVKEEMRTLAKDINYIELAMTDSYERIFVDASVYPKFQDGKIVEEA